MTPQEQVKMLREAIALTLSDKFDYAEDVRRLREALAATAPPLRYTMEDGGCESVMRDGAPVLDPTLHSTPAERAAVLDALNALAEKENAR